MLTREAVLDSIVEVAASEAVFSPNSQETSGVENFPDGLRLFNNLI